jgi:hypothetical protein
MRTLYQTEWHDIQFSDFASLSPTALAGPDFYRAFYEHFFARYHGWHELSSSWLAEKKDCASLVLSRSGGKGRILSVGCGLGAVEHFVRAHNREVELFIHDVTPAAWRWVEAEFPQSHRLLGPIPQCIPEGLQFDMVYVCAVDYALADAELTALLADIRPFLTVAGQCLIISATFDDGVETLRTARARLKSCAAELLDRAGMRRRARGQFWGWSRSRSDYLRLMGEAGYTDVEDGFVEGRDWRDYWVAGR